MNGRCIVITGVSRGLGRAMVAEFVALGHRVVGCSRSSAAIDELTGEFPGPHHFTAVDVADDEQVGRWAAEVLERGPAPDLLINNAALINANAELWRVPAEEFAALMNCNIGGVFHVIRHFVPAMIERGSGVIVNLSSGWGRSTAPEVAPYCASKWAIEGMTRALASELPAGMAAIPYNPGVIHTEMLDSCFGDSARSFPKPESWAKRAVPQLLELGPDDNGRPLSA